MRVIVADDELQARKRVARLVEQMAGVELVLACASAEELLANLAGARADVLLLDISMPGLSGLEAAALLGPPPQPSVIFVTAHAQHAVEAFELGAIDYVLKPVTAARLAKAIDRARSLRVTTALPRRLAIETRKGIELVDPDTLEYASFDGTLVTLASATEQWVTMLSLADLEARLPGKLERVDRRHLLDLAAVVRLEPRASGGFVAITRGGHAVPVSRQAGRTLRARLGA